MQKVAADVFITNTTCSVLAFKLQTIMWILQLWLKWQYFNLVDELLNSPWHYYFCSPVDKTPQGSIFKSFREIMLPASLTKCRDCESQLLQK